MDDKWNSIINESLQIFMKYGVRSVSMDDICKKMAISKKTLYQYVSNKEELIKRTLNYVIDTNYECGNIEENDGLNAIDVLLNISEQLSKFIQKINPVVSFDLEKYYPELYKEFVEKKREITFESIKNNFQKGIDEGLYRQDLNIELVANLYVRKLRDIHDPEFINSSDFTFEKIFEVMIENHIRGIANEKGIAYLEEKLKTLKFNFNKQ